MTIRLTIDNLDALPDGGPTRFEARGRSFEIGREQHLDWTLPDPGRYISGRHCEVRFEKGGYWLNDTSTNGVFVNGAAQRVKSPYRLQTGDRLAIGHYIIDVVVEEARQGSGADAWNAETPASRGAEPAAPQAPAGGNDIWTLDIAGPAPVDRRQFMPQPRREADFSNQFLPFPETGRPPAPPDPPGSGAAAWDLPGDGGPPRQAPPAAGPDPSDAAPAQAARPAPPETPPPPVDPRAMRPMPGPGERPAPAVRTPAPAPAPSLQGSGSQAGGFLAAFAAGAGVSPDVLRKRNPEELAFEIGEFVRLTTENLRQLLKARAAAKAMTKTASRTMISAANNNPLKFVPDNAEALEVMFARSRPGYLDARVSLAEAFSDLKRHDLATYAAMQKALSRLMEEFDPDAIEEKAASSTFASKKSRAWELFVARWRERESSENGILDLFLAYFAEAYDQASNTAGDAAGPDKQKG